MAFPIKDLAVVNRFILTDDCERLQWLRKENPFYEFNQSDRFRSIDNLMASLSTSVIIIPYT